MGSAFATNFVPGLYCPTGSVTKFYDIPGTRSLAPDDRAVVEIYAAHPEEIKTAPEPHAAALRRVLRDAGYMLAQNGGASDTLAEAFSSWLKGADPAGFNGGIVPMTRTARPISPLAAGLEPKACAKVARVAANEVAANPPVDLVYYDICAENVVAETYQAPSSLQDREEELERQDQIVNFAKAAIEGLEKKALASQNPADVLVFKKNAEQYLSSLGAARRKIAALIAGDARPSIEGSSTALLAEAQRSYENIEKHFLALES